MPRCKEYQGQFEEQAQHAHATGMEIELRLRTLAPRTRYRINRRRFGTHRLSLQDGECFIHIFFTHHQSHTANGVGQHPVELQQMFISEVGGNAIAFEPQSSQVGFFGFGEGGDANDVHGGEVALMCLQTNTPPHLAVKTACEMNCLSSQT
jgi:hypothetical protein